MIKTVEVLEQLVKQLLNIGESNIKLKGTTKVTDQMIKPQEWIYKHHC